MTGDHRSVVARLRAEVADDLLREGRRHLSLADRRELTRQLALSRLRRQASDRVAAGETPLDPLQEQELAHAVLDALFGLGRLQALVDDERTENIDVNGCDRVWVTYADGTKAAAPPIAETDSELVEMLRSAAARFGLSERRFDTAHPELDLRLPDGSRLSALMGVTGRPVASIRRHRFVHLTLAELVRMGSIDDGIASLLRAAVRARKNIVVAGAMNAGKTTLVRALAAEIPMRERIVTIEQAFELGVAGDDTRHPDAVALEAREANAEGVGEITMARLVRRALRMNADRVIVGEVLGDEIIPMLNAMSQGRSGSMCTIHADSSEGAFRRMASYAVQAAERLPLEATNVLIAGAIHLVVFVDVIDSTEDPEVSTSSMDGFEAPHEPPFAGLQDHASLQDQSVGPGSSVVRFPAVRRRRFVSSIREVVGADGLNVVSNEVVRPGGDSGATVGAPLRSSTLHELVAHGFQPELLHGLGDHR